VIIIKLALFEIARFRKMFNDVSKVPRLEKRFKKVNVGVRMLLIMTPWKPIVNFTIFFYFSVLN